MINIVLLVAWMLSGILAVTALAPDRESRWQFAPLAVVFGPLWVPIALEQQARQPAYAYASTEEARVIDLRESERQRYEVDAA